MVRDPVTGFDFASYANGIELGEIYAELSQDWAALFDRAFATIADPALLRVSDTDLSELDESFAGFGEKMDQLPPSPVTDVLVEHEERALLSLAEGYRELASLPEAPSPEDLRTAVQCIVQAGTAHEEARTTVAVYLESLGLDFGV